MHVRDALNSHRCYDTLSEKEQQMKRKQAHRIDLPPDCPWNYSSRGPSAHLPTNDRST